jgi:hypothetical protein
MLSRAKVLLRRTGEAWVMKSGDLCLMPFPERDVPRDVEVVATILRRPLWFRELGPAFLISGQNHDGHNDWVRAG